MAKRKSLVEKLAETRALNRRRDVAAERIDWAKREALVPKEASAAELKYREVLRAYSDRVAVLTDRFVVGALPELGSGDLLDVGALDRGIEAMRLELDRLSAGPAFRRSAGSAFDRATQHGRKSAEKLLEVSIPADKKALRLVREAFVQRQVKLLQRVNAAQAEALRKAIRHYQEGTSLRKALLHQLWVSRVRGGMIARNEVAKTFRREFERWAQEAGSEWFVYVTRRDERVRPTHAALDGKRFPAGVRPPQLDEVGCRCVLLPVEALID